MESRLHCHFKSYRDQWLTRAIPTIIRTPEIDQSNFITMLRSNGYLDIGLALDGLALMWSPSYRATASSSIW